MELSESQKETLVGSFRAKALAWWQKIETLEKTSIPKTSPLYEKRAKLLRQAYVIRNRIESIPGLSKTFEQNLDAWPIVAAIAGVGVVVWALAAFKSTGNEAERIMQENKKYNDLVKSGYTPANAMSTIQKTTVVKKEWSDVAYKALQTLPWIGGIYVVWKITKIIGNKR